MKRIKYFLAVTASAATLGLFSSCADFLDKAPDDMLTLEMIFGDKIRTEDWLAGVYSNIPDPYWGWTRSIGYDPLSDDMAPSTGWEKFGWNVVSKQIGNWSPASDWDANYWSQLPKRIRSAYIFIENGLSPITGYNADGSPVINPASGYKEKGFSEKPEIRNTKWIESRGKEGEADYVENGQVTLAGTYNMYCKREPRFYISVLYNRCWFRREQRTTRFLLGEWDGGPTHDAPQNGYLLRKKVHPDADPRSGTYPYRPGILYRLGEAYLNYAEALNEWKPGDADILKYVNLIRERAGIPVYGNGVGQVSPPEGQAAVRDAIRRERRVELNCEGIRYHDIRRWKIGEQALAGNFWGMNFFGKNLKDDDKDPDAFFTRKVYQKRVFTKKNYWFPVPQGEIDKNPNLVQNPFWK